MALICVAGMDMRFRREEFEDFSQQLTLPMKVSLADMLDALQHLDDDGLIEFIVSLDEDRQCCHFTKRLYERIKMIHDIIETEQIVDELVNGT